MGECYWSINNTQSIYEKKKKSSFQRKKKKNGWEGKKASKHRSRRKEDVDGGD